MYDTLGDEAMVFITNQCKFDLIFIDNEAKCNRFLNNMISSRGIDYSGFITKSTLKEIIKSEYEEYKSKIGRGHEDLAEFFDDKRKHLIESIK